MIKPYKNNRLKEINCSRNGFIIDTLNSNDIYELAKNGGFEGFFCHDVQYNPFTDFVNDMVAKRDLY